MHLENKGWTEKEANAVSLVPKACLGRWDHVVSLVSKDHPAFLVHQEQEVFQVSLDQRGTWALKENQVLQDNKALLDHKVFLVPRDRWVHPEARDRLENQVCLVFLVLMDFQVTPVTKVPLDRKVPWDDPAHKVHKDIQDPVVLREKVASEVSKETRETRVSMVYLDSKETWDLRVTKV